MPQGSSHATCAALPICFLYLSLLVVARIWQCCTVPHLHPLFIEGCSVHRIESILCICCRHIVALGICRISRTFVRIVTTSCGVQGTSELSKASDYPRSAPGQFPVLTANLAPDKEVHTRNYSVWCWDEEDIRDLYQFDMVQETGDDSSSRDWVPVLISICVSFLAEVCCVFVFIGHCVHDMVRRRMLESLNVLGSPWALSFRPLCFLRNHIPSPLAGTTIYLWQCCAGVLLLLCAIGLGVWLCLGRPCCSCQPMQAYSPKHSHRHLDNKGPSSVHYKSTEELAAALTTVLTTHRCLPEYPVPQPLPFRLSHPVPRPLACTSLLHSDC